MSEVRTHDADGVRVLTLDVPERRNAMGEPMAAEVRAAVADWERAGVRALVVTGAGPAFCAGADLPQLFGDPDADPRATHARLSAYYRAFLDVADLPIPTIAAVSGPAVGAGLNLALACDVRIAGPDASFGATFTRIGLHPGGGVSWALARAIGPSRALSALLAGEAITAEQAVAWGLADGPSDDPLDEAMTLAGRFASVDSQLAQSVKRAVKLAVTTDDRDAVVAYETWAQAVSASSPELAAWVAHFDDAKRKKQQEEDQ